MTSKTGVNWDQARHAYDRELPHSGNQETKAPACPKHGEPYVIQPGSNRCPRGRKAKVNCR